MYILYSMCFRWCFPIVIFVSVLTGTPTNIKNLVKAAIDWLNYYVLSGKFKPWNAFFSGSGKGSDVSSNLSFAQHKVKETKKTNITMPKLDVYRDWEEHPT